MQIIGLRIENYIGKVCQGGQNVFTYTDEELQRHIICAVLSDNQRVEITLWTTYGECGSGWDCATWGHYKVELVQRFRGYQYYPKRSSLIVPDVFPLSLDVDNAENEENNEFQDVENEVFQVYHIGKNNDGYYPSGDYNVNMNLFTETVRATHMRPVWIFIGPSNSGKSYLSSQLKDVSVYETDSSPNLPTIINESVVVLGNKYQFSLKDIRERLFGNTTVHTVTFI